MYNLLKRLSKKHDITLVSFIRNLEEEQYLKELSFCKEVYTVLRGRAYQFSYLYRAMTSHYPWLLATYENQKMRTLLTSLLSAHTYDVLHVEPFYVIPSLPEHKLPLVVCEHNIEYEVYGQYVKNFPVSFMRPLLAKDVHKIRTWEQKSWRVASSVVSVSHHDKNVIESYLGHEIALIPNGVDTNYFAYEPHVRNQQSLLFVGNFRWLPNIEAVHTLLTQIWPLIRAKYPSMRLRIVGKDLPSKIKQNTHSQGCEFIDFVTDIRQEYQRADALIAPHKIAGGTKFKILESFSSGLPVITSKEGIQGIEALTNVDYLEATTVEQYVACVDFINDKKNTLKKMTDHARKLVQKQYDWEQVAQSLNAVWRSYAS